jgi:hypothetical protein
MIRVAASKAEPAAAMMRTIWADNLTRGSLKKAMRIVSLVLAGLLLVSISSQAQTLSIQGDRFAVDGTPKFLTFVTYFGAMGAPHITNDLHAIKAFGFDGIRIWPNLDTGPQLMNGDGSLRPDELKRLLSILDTAKQERLIVDVTFTYEHIRGMTPATARTGIANATAALRAYDNLLFDIQNERNVFDRRHMSEDDVARIYAAIKAVDPSRIAFASNAPVADLQEIVDFENHLGLDVVAYHDPRPSNWYEFGVIDRIVRAMRSTGRPAYLQEPNTTRDDLFFYPSNDRAFYFQQAIANAKLAGAAAWCFHTEVGVDFRDGPEFFEDRLREHPEPEWAFVTTLMPSVSLLASKPGSYLVAEGGGGGAVLANRTSAGPWETFKVAVLSGGPPLSGDRVALVAADGSHYLQAVGGGGAAMRAVGAAVGPWETFVLERSGGSGLIRTGDAVTLRANDTPWFVVAESGGGANVNVNSTNRGAWETFTITIQ